jgi:four helix bundle protein
MTSSQNGNGTNTRILSYRDLIVWQKARKLAASSFALARRLPADEQFGMKPQMQRAAISVTSNIAEGHGRFGKGDFARHLSIARGSLMELENLLEIGADVGYFEVEAIQAPLSIADEVGRMIFVLVKKLGSRQMLPRTRT